MQKSSYTLQTLSKDLVAGLVVFLVALPLCLGIALASGSPELFAGLLAGIVGGMLVGLLSGSQTSVSGPAAGLTAIVATQIGLLGSYEAFLFAVVLGGILQIAMSLLKAGALSAFFPSSVIKGLLAAIGVILILKQIPHLLGHDSDPEGDMAFEQIDKENTFSEIAGMFDGSIHYGAIIIGAFSIAILVLWSRSSFLKKLLIPAPLVVVIFGVAMNAWFVQLGEPWAIRTSHLVQVPVANSISEFLGFLSFPDFSRWADSGIYLAGITIAIVASLETLLNLEAVDRIDPLQRHSPPNRELFAQGVGNIVTGLIGGIPVTSVIVRSSVNIHAGGQTKVSAIFHGFLLFVCVSFFPLALNYIPLSALAAILLVTGLKLASPELFAQMWSEGRYQFIPFIATLISIVLTDLLKGILIGLGISILFVLNSNLRRPLRKFVEKHVGGKVTIIELSNQVSFLNRAAIDSALREAPYGSKLVIDANQTDYIDPDVLSLIRDYKKKTAKMRGIELSFRGFKPKFRLPDDAQHVHHSTYDRQQQMTPAQALDLLREGNDRFRSGQRMMRHTEHQLNATSQGQHPFAVILSCIDSRAPAETLFDLGLGDIFNIRIAGNVTSAKVLGSMEYGCAIAGAKLILILGHSNCGAVTSSVNTFRSDKDLAQLTGCQHLESIVQEIRHSIDPSGIANTDQAQPTQLNNFIETVTKLNVLHSIDKVLRHSNTIRTMVEQRRIGIVGGKYDIATSNVEFYLDQSSGF